MIRHWKMERQRRKEELTQERSQRLEAMQAQKEERVRRDLLWGQEHAELSDEELLEYVRAKAKEYGYDDEGIEGLLSVFDEMRKLDPTTAYEEMVLLEQAV